VSTAKERKERGKGKGKINSGKGHKEIDRYDYLEGRSGKAPKQRPTTGLQVHTKREKGEKHLKQTKAKTHTGLRNFTCGLKIRAMVQLGALSSETRVNIQQT